MLQKVNHLPLGQMHQMPRGESIKLLFKSLFERWRVKVMKSEDEEAKCEKLTGWEIQN